MRTCVYLSLIVMAGLSASAAEKGGKIEASAMKKWVIVVAPDAIPSEKYAAEEFQALFKQCTGADLKIANATPRKRAILIGLGAQGKTKAITADSIAKLGDEGLSIVVERNVIRIAGGQPRGTLYGVYEFFERYFGVRFLTHDHTYIAPDAGSRTIPLETHTYTPPLSFRYSFYTENHEHHEFATRLRVNTVSTEEKLGGVTPQNLINHSLFRWVTVEKYGQSHPEYFALVNGERKLEVGGGGPEVCVTNPEVVDIVTEGVLKDLDANPKLRNISVSQNDNDQYCHCATCEAINQREGTPMGSHLAFVNAVAERVEKKYPDVKIGTLAYWYTRKAPKTIVPRKNMQIQLCSIECCTLHPINDPNCAKNREFYQDMMAWKAICNDIWIWNYNTNFSNYDLPFPNLRVIAPNVRFFVENNAHGIFMQANASGNAGEMSDLRNYVMSRCLWDPKSDGAALVKEFCTLHYGKAGQPILDYLTMLHDNANAMGVHPGCFPKPQEVGLTPDIAQKALKYFQQASSVADDDTVRKRVEKASICAYKAGVMMVPGKWSYEDGACRFSVPQEWKGVSARYVELCKTYNMSSVSEGVGSGPYLEDIKQRDADYPAMCLENAVWNLIVLPEQNGKIVSMFNKPAKRELVAGMTHGDILHGTHEELILKGVQDGAATKFTGTSKGTALELAAALSDGTTFVRRIALRPNQPDVISFDSTLTHRGSQPVKYQFKSRPEFVPASRSDKPEVVGAYVKSGGVWKLFNRGWKGDTGPDLELLRQGKDGVFSFYNHEAHFGVQVNYAPKQVDHPYVWWWPDWPQINLEIFTPLRELKQGEAMKLEYQIRYLADAPK
ncbi:MAG: DUF4838 domain-containing protein [Candidatus Hydrogenedentes bacterium]|nr:DUF4838 domain-containing protein [Candidatus Hydrogenedentota bacterium]